MQWFANGGAVSATLALYGVAGSLPGTATLSADMRSVTMDFGPNDALKGHDWQRVFGPTGSTSDTFTTFWFDGYSQPSYGTPAGPVAPVNPAPATNPDNGDVGMTINDGAQYTNDPNVTLAVVAPSYVGNAAGDPNCSPDRYRVANDGRFPQREGLPGSIHHSVEARRVRR